MSRPSATPAECEQIKALVAESKTAAEIGGIVGRTAKSIRYIVRAFELGPWLGRSSHAPGITHIPDDFAARWETSSQSQLTKHYRRSSATVCLWTKRLGLVRPVGLRVGQVAKPKVVKIAKAPKPIVPVKRQWGTQGANKPAPVTINRDMSRLGLAVERLRKYGPVNRCLPNGRLSPAGLLWLRGSTVLTDTDVIERAEWLASRERKAA